MPHRQYLPEQSNQIRSCQPQTEHLTWFDQRQKNIATGQIKQHINWITGLVNQVLNSLPGRLRVLVDSSWDKHNEYEVKPRIRGKIKLPTLENKLSVVFGDDSLDNELQNNVAITNENPAP